MTETNLLFSEIDTKRASMFVGLRPAIRQQDADDSTLSNSIQMLLTENLFDVALENFKKKIVGEIAPIKTIFAVSTGGSLTLNANATSTNLCVNAKSGAGKDTACKGVLNVYNNETKLFHRTKITPQTFTYWKRKEIKEGFTWDGKIVYLEDCSSSLLNCDVFKTMSSGGSRATVIKDQCAIDITIPGKPVMIITTAESEPNLELLRRFPLIYLNESKEQTRAIIKKIAFDEANNIKPDYDKTFVLALKLLQPVSVSVPFAVELGNVFMNYDAVLFRTHFKRILDYIKFSATIHQYQRQKNDEGFIVAEWKDWDNVRDCVQLITTNKLGFNLTHKQTAVLNLIKLNPGVSAPRLLTMNPPYSKKGLYKCLDSLSQYGFVSVALNDSSVSIYSAVDSETVNLLPTSQNIIKSNTLSTSSTSSTLSTQSTLKQDSSVLGEPSVPRNECTKSVCDVVLKLSKGSGLVPKSEVEKVFGSDFEKVLVEGLARGEVFEPKPDYLGVVR